MYVVYIPSFHVLHFRSSHFLNKYKLNITVINMTLLFIKDLVLFLSALNVDSKWQDGKLLCH